MPFEQVQPSLDVCRFESTQQARPQVAERVSDFRIELPGTDFNDRLCQQIAQICRGLWRRKLPQIPWCNGSRCFPWIFSQKFRVLSRIPSGSSSGFSTGFCRCDGWIEILACVGEGTESLAIATEPPITIASGQAELNLRKIAFGQREKRDSLHLGLYIARRRPPLLPSSAARPGCACRAQYFLPASARALHCPPSGFFF
jgi:hypothetical protein